MIDSSDSPELRTVSGTSRAARGSEAVSSSSSVMPSTPFIGVRISWLMLARNSLLARLAPSATSLAIRSSAEATRSCWTRWAASKWRK